MVEALKDEDVIRRLAPEGLIADGNPPAQFARQIATELPMWTEVVRRANLKPE